MQNYSLNDFCKRFALQLDMNGDLAFTITDIWLQIKFLFYIPAKLVVGALHGSDRIAIFFEIGCKTGEGWGGGIFSAFAWFSLVVITANALDGFARNKQKTN